MSIQSEIDRIKAGKADAKAALIERGVDPGDATIEEYGNKIRAIPSGVTSFNGRTGAVEPQAGDYTADQVGALPISGGTLTGQLNCGGRLLRGVADPASGQDAVNLQYAQANFAPKDSFGGAGKRACRFVVGTSTAGWTEDDCDYLCDGSADEVEINAAIQALPATGGEIVILDGTYTIKSTITLDKSGVLIRGNGLSTVLKRALTSSGAVLAMSASEGRCSVCCLTVDSSSTKVSGTMCIRVNSGGLNTIRGVKCIGSYEQIYVMASNNDNNLICDSIFEDCGNYGVGVYSVNNIISNNRFIGCKQGAICSMGGGSNVISNNSFIDNDIGIFTITTKNLIIGNKVKRGSGLTTDYTSSQYTIQVKGNRNLVVGNFTEGKAVTDSGDTNTIVNNIY